MTLAILQWLLPWLVLALWCAWWLWCVNWKDTWPVLARGGWVGVVLLVLTIALAWSAMYPAKPNFWWQLGCTSALALVALFCGWAQGQLGWEPPPVTFEPAAHGHDHGHGHGHGSSYSVGRSAPEVVHNRPAKDHGHGHH
jgi:hypothetical protein